jgi:predicted O-methyltransferase YrrM
LILTSEVEAYLARLLPASHEVLAEMEAQARRRDIPIVGPVVARLFRLLAQVAGARRVFELGSAIGYSTLWWAEAVGPQGEVFYTDNSRANAEEAAAYFRRAGCAERIRILTGEALAMLQATPGDFDIVFLDLNKEQYGAALDAAVPRLRRGGLLVADNVLWRGEAARTPPPEGAARHMAEFNRKLYADGRLEPVILPLRDGVAVARRAA